MLTLGVTAIKGEQSKQMSRKAKPELGKKRKDTLWYKVFGEEPVTSRFAYPRWKGEKGTSEYIMAIASIFRNRGLGTTINYFAYLAIFYPHQW